MATTSTLYATGATGATGTGKTWTSATNAVGSTSGTYAAWTSTTASVSTTLDLTGYDFSAQVAAGSTITSVTAAVKNYQSSTSTTVVTALTAQLLSGATAIGTPTSLTRTATTTNVQTLTFSGANAPTAAQLASPLTLRIAGTRGNSTTSLTVNVDYASLAVTYTAPVAGPKIATFTDDFATQDTVDWNWNTNASVSGGNLVLTPTTGYNGIQANAAYDLTGSAIAVEVVQPSSTAAPGSQELIFYLEDRVAGAGGDVRFNIYGGASLQAKTKLSGVESVLMDAPYNPVAQRWLQISESGGTVVWSTSPDGSTWTQYATWARTGGIVATNLYPAFQAGYWDAETAIGDIWIGGVNVAPAGTVSASLSGAGSLATTVVPARTVSASLSGSGSLTAASAPNSSATASLSGSGSLTAASTPNSSATASLSGSGSLTAASAPNSSATASLSGSGSLTTASTSVRPVSLSGSGSLSAETSPLSTKSAALSGAGVLAAASTPQVTRSGSLSGSGSLTATIAHTFYVAGPGGNDAANGLSSGTAWATIAKVNATTFVPGDTILFQRGVTFSNANLSLHASGTATQRITIGAYGTGALPIFDGGGASGSATAPVMEIAANYVTVQDVQVQNATKLARYGILWSGTDGLCQRCTITLNPFGIQAADGAHRLRVTQSNLSTNNIVIVGSGADDDTGAQAVVLQAADNCEIDHNTINGCYNTSPDYGVDGSAVEIFGAIGTVVHHNTATDNGNFTELGNTRTNNTTYYDNIIISTASGPANQAALMAQGTGTWGPVANTNFYHNTVVLRGPTPGGLIVGAGATASIHNNIIDSSYAGTSSGTKVDEGHNVWSGYAGDFWSTANAGQGVASTSIVANPLFVSSTDFHLQSGSPAINRGVDFGYTTDYAGAPRLMGSSPDAGAYEWQSAVPVNLSGSGTLTAASNPQTSATVGLTGAGSLTASASNPQTSATVGLTGAGSLTASTSNPQTSAAVVLAGAGTLQASASASSANGASVNLSGSGSLTAVPSIAVSKTATLSGTGALTAVPSIAVFKSVALDGSGALTAVPSIAVFKSVALDGSGSLTSTTSGAGRIGVSLMGSGSLSVTVFVDGAGANLPPLTSPVTAAFVFDGAGTAAFRDSGNGTAAFSGDGATTATFSLDGTGTAAFSDSGSGTAAYRGDGVVIAAFSSDGVGAGYFA